MKKLIYKKSIVLQPQIPYTLDILYILRLSDKDKYWWYSAANQIIYCLNVLQVSHYCCAEIMAMKTESESEMHRIVAQSIVDLTPEVAHNTTAFISAKEILGGGADDSYY